MFKGKRLNALLGFVLGCTTLAPSGIASSNTKTPMTPEERKQSARNAIDYPALLDTGSPRDTNTKGYAFFVKNLPLLGGAIDAKSQSEIDEERRTFLENYFLHLKEVCAEIFENDTDFIASIHKEIVWLRAVFNPKSAAASVLNNFLDPEKKMPPLDGLFFSGKNPVLAKLYTACLTDKRDGRDQQAARINFLLSALALNGINIQHPPSEDKPVKFWTGKGLPPEAFLQVSPYTEDMLGEKILAKIAREFGITPEEMDIIVRKRKASCTPEQLEKYESAETKLKNNNIRCIDVRIEFSKQKKKREGEKSPVTQEKEELFDVIDKKYIRNNFCPEALTCLVLGLDPETGNTCDPSCAFALFGPWLNLGHLCDCGTFVRNSDGSFSHIDNINLVSVCAKKLVGPEVPDITKVACLECLWMAAQASGFRDNACLRNIVHGPFFSFNASFSRFVPLALFALRTNDYEKNVRDMEILDSRVPLQNRLKAIQEPSLEYIEKLCDRRKGGKESHYLKMYSNNFREKLRTANNDVERFMEKQKKDMDAVVK